MSGQFVARRGLIALGDTTITGSLNISQNIVAGGTVQATFDTSTATAISGAFDSVSSSLASDITLNASSIDSLNAASSSYATINFVTSSYLPLSGGTVSGNLTVTGSLTGTLATSAQTNVTSLGTLSSLAVSGNLTVDTNTLFVDAANNRVSIGTTTPFSDSLFQAQANLNSAVYNYFINQSDGASGASFILLAGGSGTDLRIGAYGSGHSTLANQATIFNHKLTGSLILGTEGTEKVRVLPSGGITFNGDTAAANALDDYEEGTWSPVYVSASGSFTSVTYDVRTFGTYTKIGNTVYVQAAIRTFELTIGTASGSVRIGGLPFTINSTAFRNPTGAVSTGLDFNTNHPIATIGIENTTQLGLLYRTSANGGTINLDVTDLATGTNMNLMRFNIFYTV